LPAARAARPARAGLSWLERGALAASLLLAAILGWRLLPPARTAVHTPEEHRSDRKSTQVAEEDAVPPQEHKTEEPKPPEAKTPDTVAPDKIKGDQSKPEHEQRQREAYGQKLTDTVLSFEFVDTPAVEALAYMQAKTGVPFQVDSKEFTEVPITLRVEKMEAKLAMGWILRLMNADFELSAKGVRVFKHAPVEQVYVDVTYDLSETLVDGKTPKQVLDHVKTIVRPHTWKPEGKADAVLEGHKVTITQTEECHGSLKGVFSSLSVPERIIRGMTLKESDVDWALAHLASEDALQQKCAYRALVYAPDELRARIAKAAAEAAEPAHKTLLSAIAKEQALLDEAKAFLARHPDPAGLFARRAPKEREAAVKAYGGSQATESAVENALHWLALHQEADGHWDCKKFGGKQADTALTGLALLAFLGQGHSVKEGKYKDCVKRAVAWLISIQRQDGSLYQAGETHGVGYHHGIAGLALVEAAAGAQDLPVAMAAQRALDYSTGVHQHHEGGWRYAPGNEGDLCITTWFVMQLKAAKSANLKVPDASIASALNFVKHRELKQDGKTVGFGYMAPDDKPRTSAMGSLCLMALGGRTFEFTADLDQTVLKGGLPAWTPGGGSVDLYYWFYGSQYFFQRSAPVGSAWKTWNEALSKALVENQRKGGDEDGSYDPVGAYADYLGRAGQTALAALCLETYYRYAKFDGKEKAAP
ncbi:MAG: terpene cyclase/mutase family protein, partial [Planctomycetota bacterium]|nr:terpene cyclase/mutase family protein [Planctomycetota bacterium]